MLPQEGTTWDQDALFASKLGCAWHYFNSSPGAYQVSLSPLSPAKQMVKGFQRPARLIGVDKFVVGTLISQRRCSAAASLASTAGLAIQLEEELCLKELRVRELCARELCVCDKAVCNKVVCERVVC